MSNIKSGRSKHSRRATNFPTKPAQQRINESLAPFRDKIENALAIDSVEAIVFKRVRAGRPCSCTQHHVTAEDIQVGGDFEGYGNQGDENKVHRPSTGTKVGAIFDLGNGDDVFGEASYHKSIAPREIELNDLPKSNKELGERPVYNDEVFTETDFAGNNELCGICYNQKVIPAFEAVNYSYIVLSIADLVEVSGYKYNTDELPAKFEAQSKIALARFELTIPKYFISATFSIRNNVEVLGGFNVLKYNGLALSKAVLDENRGKTIYVTVDNVKSFTHAVILFKLNDFEVRANLSTENEVINYENEVTIGDMNVVMSSRSGSVRSEDLLVIPQRNLVLKINGAPRKTTADKSLWQWTLQARAVQRSEPTARIFKHYKIY